MNVIFSTSRSPAECQRIIVALDRSQEVIPRHVIRVVQSQLDTERYQFDLRMTGFRRPMMRCVGACRANGSQTDVHAEITHDPVTRFSYVAIGLMLAVFALVGIGMGVQDSNYALLVGVGIALPIWGFSVWRNSKRESALLADLLRAQLGASAP